MPFILMVPWALMMLVYEVKLVRQWMPSLKPNSSKGGLQKTNKQKNSQLLGKGCDNSFSNDFGGFQKKYECFF